MCHISPKTKIVPEISGDVDGAEDEDVLLLLVREGVDVALAGSEFWKSIFWCVCVVCDCEIWLSLFCKKKNDYPCTSL